jgi:pimeloyl-ACP methyl ester carboxylesterase
VTRRRIGCVLGGLAALTSAGAAYQAIADARDRRRYAPLGRLVDVNGHRLHIYCLGRGSPTVVLEAGLSHGALEWSPVQAEVAKFTHVCAYDRAGHGWSDPGPKPRTSQRIAEELHTLLTRAGIEAPYVLVGQSIGGLHARLFASLYPGEVVGMVLVDSSHEDQRDHLPWRSLKSRLLEELNWQRYRLNPLWARLGLLRLRRQPGGAPEALPSDVRPMARAMGVRSQAYDWIFTEGPAIETCEAQARAARPLGDVPLIVLSAHFRGCPPGVPSEQEESYRQRSDRAWMQLQRELTQLSTQSTHIVVEESGHNIHLDRPGVVVDAIRQVVDEVRRARSSEPT